MYLHLTSAEIAIKIYNDGIFKFEPSEDGGNFFSIVNEHQDSNFFEWVYLLPSEETNEKISFIGGNVSHYPVDINAMLICSHKDIPINDDSILVRGYPWRVYFPENKECYLKKILIEPNYIKELRKNEESQPFYDKLIYWIKSALKLNKKSLLEEIAEINLLLSQNPKLIKFKPK
ncbi:hypothetical protein ACWIUH_08745 [Ursidibacter arcticus]